MVNESLSRRGFLTGVITTAAAAALPTFAAPMENPCKEVLLASDTHFALFPDMQGYHEPKFYLYPAQWERWSKELGDAFMERRCARIEMMPGDLIYHTDRMARGARRSAQYTREITNERQAQRLPVSRNRPQRKPQYLAERTNAIHRGAFRAKERTA